MDGVEGRCGVMERKRRIGNGRGGERNSAEGRILQGRGRNGDDWAILRRWWCNGAKDGGPCKGEGKQRGLGVSWATRWREFGRTECSGR